MQNNFIANLSVNKWQLQTVSIKAKFINALAAICAIYILAIILNLLPYQSFATPLLASMGASAFLLFVIPHSPMSQPWPLLGGHVVSTVVAVIVTHMTDDAIVASACTVGGSLLAMQLLNCLHPPGAATALAVLAGSQLHNMGLQPILYVVIGNAAIMLLMAYTINNLVLNRRYPLFTRHYPDRARFLETPNLSALNLNREDIQWALSQMDGLIDVSEEDLIDIYGLAQEHALSERQEQEEK